MVKKNTIVTKIVFDKVNKKIERVETSSGSYEANSYVFATGGVSHPETGSTGDGFKWLKDLGHTVQDPSPTIVPLRVSDPWVINLTGVTVEPMKITFYLDGKKAFKKEGKVLFTHFGLSGPLILNSSKKVSDLLHEGEVTVKIDLLPNIEIGELKKRMIALFDENKNKTLRNTLKEIVPPGTIKGLEIFFSKNNPINFETKVHSVSKEEREEIVQNLKSMPATIDGLMGYDRAVVADGGVVLEEIDTKTMRSKLFENLFVTGDLLHITRPTGGFSLQLCWTTGYVAGQNA